MIRNHQAAPVARAERIESLDVLRGFALLGVFVVHITTFGVDPVLATDAEVAALPTARVDGVVTFLVDWLLYNKANTLFTFLFGVGFGVQMARIEGRGGRFETIYLRRLTVLLGFGLAHLFLLWPWDILHLYALAGFALFALRGLSIRAMLILGGTLALLGMPVALWILDATGVSGPAYDAAYSDTAIASRQVAALSGSLVAWSSTMMRLMLLDFFASGLIIAWFLYALGRFLLGVVVARLGWIEQAASRLADWRRWLLRLLPAGLALELWATVLSNAVEAEVLDHGLWVLAAEALHAVAIPTLAAGYVCLVLVLWHAGRLARLFGLLGAVGRMALTNYVGQSVLILLTFSSLGLGLAGRVGSAATLALGLAGFLCQMLLSHVWLRHFAYGPLEWFWRWLTYGARPRMRLASPALQESSK